jgi:acetyl-CoA C-acetyltransferase
VLAFVEDYSGLGTVETYTVIYNRQGEAVFGIVIAWTPNGRRFICRSNMTQDW